MVKFSVVIPMFNRAKVIHRTINSILNQTFQNFEIVIVDDGSSDHSVEVVESFHDERIRLIKQPNGGANSARNNGILNAKGEYISFLDSDDTYEPTMLEDVLKVFETDPEVGFVYTEMDLITPEGKHVPSGLGVGLSGYCYKEALTQGYIAATSAISAKRESFVIAGMFDTSLPASQDDDICFKMAKHVKVGVVNKVLAHMYNDANNRITNLKNPAKGWWMLWNKYEEDVISLCGREVMAGHYMKCVFHFIRAKMYKQSKEAYLKYKMYGGRDKYFAIRVRFFLGKVINKIKSII